MKTQTILRQNKEHKTTLFEVTETKFIFMKKVSFHIEVEYGYMTKKSAPFENYYAASVEYEKQLTQKIKSDKLRQIVKNKSINDYSSVLPVRQAPIPLERSKTSRQTYSRTNVRESERTNVRESEQDDSASYLMSQSLMSSSYTEPSYTRDDSYSAPETSCTRTESYSYSDSSSSSCSDSSSSDSSSSSSD